MVVVLPFVPVIPRQVSARRVVEQVGRGRPERPAHVRHPCARRSRRPWGKASGPLDQQRHRTSVDRGGGELVTVDVISRDACEAGTGLDEPTVVGDRSDFDV